MWRTIPTALFGWLFLFAPAFGQDVFLPRELRPLQVTQPEKEAEKATPANEPGEKHAVAAQPSKATSIAEPPANLRSSSRADAVKFPTVTALPPNPHTEAAKTESAKAEPEKAPTVKEPAGDTRSERKQTAKVKSDKGPKTAETGQRLQRTRSDGQAFKPETGKEEGTKATISKEPTVNVRPEKTQLTKVAQVEGPATQEAVVDVQMSNRSIETASTKVADGFDFPVGKPDAEGYYKARGFRSGGHVGEDWDGVRGGDTDKKDPIFCIGNGVVVFARDVRRGWGNVVIVRHAFREGGVVKHIDSLYGHLHTIMVKRGQRIARGQQIGTMGTAHGRYDAHLHLEIRKNLEIGMSRAKFQKNFSNYYDPSQFIESHRRLSGGGESFRVAMNTFTHDAAFRFDDAPSGSARKHRGLISATP